METFDNYTIKRAQELGTAKYNKKMIIGTALAQTNLSNSLAAIAFFNGQPYHAQPVSVSTYFFTKIDIFLCHSLMPGYVVFK